MPFSQYLASGILNWLTGSTFPAAISNVYISLHNGDPGVACTANDVTATITGTANRVAVPAAQLSAIVPVLSGGFEKTNTATALLTIDSVNVSVVNVTHYALWSAITGGDALLYDNLSTPAAVGTGDLVKFQIGSLAIRIV